MLQIDLPVQPDEMAFNVLQWRAPRKRTKVTAKELVTPRQLVLKVGPKGLHLCDGPSTIESFAYADLERWGHSERNPEELTLVLKTKCITGRATGLVIKRIPGLVWSFKTEKVNAVLAPDARFPRLGKEFGVEFQSMQIIEQMLSHSERIAKAMKQQRRVDRAAATERALSDKLAATAAVQAAVLVAEAEKNGFSVWPHHTQRLYIMPVSLPALLLHVRSASIAA